MSRPAAAMPACASGRGCASPPPQSTYPATQSADLTADDDTLAAMYVRMWSLATGRRLKPGVNPGQLSADDLIAFWADDLSSPASGRHAAPDTGRGKAS